MEDKTPPETTPPPAAHTAQALRDLHDRARNALAAQRERMSRLEVNLTQQLDTIAGTLAEQIGSAVEAGDTSKLAAGEIERLHLELEQARAAWQTEREQFVAQAAVQAQLLDRKQSELDAATADRSTNDPELDSRQQALDDRATELNHRERELCQRQELLDVYAEQCAAQQSQLTATESALDKQQSTIAEREAAIESSRTQLDRDRTDLVAREQTWQNGLAELTFQRESLCAERDALEAERVAFAAAHAAFDAERDAASAQLAKLANTNQLQDNELGAQLADAQRQLVEERAAWERERGSVDEQRRLLAQERDELATALNGARIELAAARELAGAAAERDELQQKFDLALQDMQRLRGRVAEAEQELSSRPAVDQSESVELVHLRAERDALAERITELEQRPTAPADGDADQERADLQRRFELAVEDVRDLKKKNAQLETQLATAASGAPASAAGGGGSWEAMKRQMLANLEDEGDDVDAERADERATIENTIRITDDAMAAKDLEIAELKSRLAESDSAVPDANEAVRQLVDADAVVAEHRTRTAQLQEEMQGKLRAAELELSVERAKTCPRKGAVGRLESRARFAAVERRGAERPGVAHPPKRRWLSKLGLSGDDEEVGPRGASSAAKCGGRSLHLSPSMW